MSLHTKRDQLHAHVYQVGRLVSALVNANPDAITTPMRRSNVGTVAGCLIGVVIMVVVALIGLFSPRAGDNWRESGTLVVVRETGSRYLVVNGILRPVLNVASALLVGAGGDRAVVIVSEKDLRGTPQGAPVGIPGAPEVVPSANRLSAGPWLVCAVDVIRGDVSVPGVQVRLERPSSTVPVPDDRGVVVVTPTGDHYLIWRDQRLRIADRKVLVALGLDVRTPVTVTPAWLNTVPAGPDLTFRSVPGAGEPGAVLGGTPTVVGQVVEVAALSVPPAYYLVTRDGVAPIGRTDAALRLGDPAAAGMPGGNAGPIRLPAAAVADHVIGSMATPGYPPGPLTASNDIDFGERSLCIEATFAGEGASYRPVTVDRKDLSGARAVAAAGHANKAVADLVFVPTGSGALVASQAAPGVRDGGLYLVDRMGVRYPLPGEEVSAALGFGGVRPLEVPRSWLALLPTGPVLDPQEVTVERLWEN